MLPAGDYTKQLEEIARALNRPSTPVWLVAIFSAVLGVIGGLVGQSLMMIATDAYRRYKLRRVLYLDMADLFFAVDSIVEFKEIDDAHRYQWQEQELATHLTFRGEKYVRDNQEIYVQTGERLVADMLYLRFHKILDEKNSMAVNTNLALRITANTVTEGTLQKKYFKRFLRPKSYERLMQRIEYHQKQDEELRARMGLSK